MDPLVAANAASRREHLLIAGAAGYAPNMSDGPDKLQAIAAASAVFSALSVPYALIGGLAVGIRSGIPRATLDVDFAVPCSVDLDALSHAFVAGGFKRTGRFPHSLNFVHESGEPVQLAFDAEFDAMIARAELVTLGGLELYVVTREDLVAMKRRAAADPARRRSKALRDQADIALLEGDIPGDDEGW